jgi:hypothetical protein
VRGGVVDADDLAVRDIEGEIFKFVQLVPEVIDDVLQIGDDGILLVADPFQFVEQCLFFDQFVPVVLPPLADLVVLFSEQFVPVR